MQGIRQANSNGPPMDHDGELLPLDIGCADGWTSREVAEADRVGRRTEVDVPPVEDAIDGGDERFACGGDRRDRKDTHPRQSIRDLLRGQGQLVREDLAKVGPGLRPTRIEKLLQGAEILACLVHPDSSGDRRRDRDDRE